MLENITSPYILKMVFNNIDEKRKLELVKYNKNIQNKMDIKIINYKNICKRYFIGDKNGIGKEYNNDDYLIFEGDYKNGKKNGKGKEYNNNLLIFEGEYKDGKRNGNATKYIYREYYIMQARRSPKNSKIELNDYYIEYKFVGEYLNGKKWNGKEYDWKNKITYILKDGKGYVTKNIHKLDKIIYEGEYLKGERNGKVKEYYDNNLIFEGEYLVGKRWNGKGKEYNNGELILKENI